MAVHMRDHLDEVALVNQLAADRAVSEMVDLRPVQIIHVDASVARQLLRVFDVRLKSLGKIRRGGLIGLIADWAGLSGAAAGAGAIAQPRLVRMPLADPATVVAAGTPLQCRSCLATETSAGCH